MPSALLMFSISTRLWVPLVVHVTLSPVFRPETVSTPVAWSTVTTAFGLVLVAEIMLTCVSLLSPSTKFTPGSAAVVKAEILTVVGPLGGFVWLTVKDAEVVLKTFWKAMLASTSASFWSRLGMRRFELSRERWVQNASAVVLIWLPLTPKEVVLLAWLILSTSLVLMFPPWD